MRIGKGQMELLIQMNERLLFSTEHIVFAQNLCLALIEDEPRQGH